MFNPKKFDKEIRLEINKQTFRGASALVMKKLYIKQNCFDVDEDFPVYRIFELPNQLADIRNSKFSLVNPAVYKDRYENPLLNWVFTDETGESFTLNGVIENYYVSPWTYEEVENPYSWILYTRNNNMGIRIKTTVGKIMDEMLNLYNPFYMLQFHAGKVDYFDKEDIDKWLAESHYTDFLDSLGQMSVSSLMALRNKFSDEKEIRFAFSHIPSDKDNQFVIDNVTIKDGICKHPLQWRPIIDEIVLDPRISDEQFEETEQQLRKYGFTCDIKHSTCR
jgi:hypothetical protein